MHWNLPLRSVCALGIVSALAVPALMGCGGGGTSSATTSSGSSSSGGGGGSGGGGSGGGSGGATPTCTDAIKNGAETDVDCGGDACGPCANGEACAGNDDCTSASCIDGTCSACQLGVNLIVNGDAEMGSAGANHDDVVPIPGWVTTGNLTVLKYGSQPGYPTPQSSTDADKGMNVFIGGAGATSSITQDVDLSMCADLIDAGKLQMELSGWLGGTDADLDYAEFKASLTDMNGADKGTTTIGPVTQQDRMAMLALQMRTTTVDVPTVARKATLVLQMTRFTGSYNNGSGDTLSLKLLHK